jgi:hypothetical protein
MSTSGRNSNGGCELPNKENIGKRNVVLKNKLILNKQSFVDSLVLIIQIKTSVLEKLEVTVLVANKFQNLQGRLCINYPRFQ